LVANAATALPPPGTAFDVAGRKLRQATHRTIAAVTEALETFAFNVAVARIHEFANAIGDSADAGAAKREALEAITRLAAPMMPHLAEEMWSLLRPGAAELVAELPWLEADPALLKAETVTLAVQVLGKLRGTFQAAPGASNEALLEGARAVENVAKHLEGRTIVKEIVVPGKLVNFVVR